ncbi:hypothetical protein [Pigmentibacter ruber]|uniref:hypothetical protein n=1 Tax=Pigmentibacter ruber TaxID=2683196 RepID=UPI00131AB17E|nr:hypothetical protein [Pigmentibacter ruber]BFD31925.1 hypothetical protein GTC16762_15430 [Pigmentibacter ruber]
MKYFLLFIIIISTFVRNNVYATSRFLIFNKTNEVLEFINDSYIKYTLYPIHMMGYNKVNIEEYGYFYNGDDLYVNNIFHLKLKEKNIACSWISILGFQIRHGVVIDIFIDHQLKGQFCANKYSIVDIHFNAYVEVFKTSAGKYQIKFLNVGWWQNDTVAPVQLELEV